MDILQSFTTYIILSIVATAAWAPLLIDWLYKFNIVVRHVLTRNKMNEEFIKIHAHKSGTPTMGGLMISATVFLLVLLAFPASALKSVFLIGWFLMTLYGFVEGSMVFARKVDEKFRLLQETFGWRLGKLGILYVICAGMLMLIGRYLGVESITLLPNVVIPLTIASALIGGLAMVLAIYGMEITDGLDGLVTGQFLIALMAYLVIIVLTGRLELVPYLGLIVGSTIVYLYFNINPARVFMGGTGTLPIGFALMLFAVLTNTVPILFILGMIFWVELFSSMSQIIAIRFFKKRIFKLAPLHHHFEAIGWPETKVVQRFWLFAGVFALLALWVFSMWPR
jgi:phospho-N-acetylmuramoyl-pentapeptide-transferase